MRVSHAVSPLFAFFSQGTVTEEKSKATHHVYPSPTSMDDGNTLGQFGNGNNAGINAMRSYGSVEQSCSQPVPEEWIMCLGSFGLDIGKIPPQGRGGVPGPKKTKPNSTTASFKYQIAKNISEFLHL